MRIAFVLNQSLESPSGLGRYWPLSTELAKRGYEVHIIAPHHHFSALNQRAWRQEGVEIHYVAQMHVKKIESEKSYFNPLSLLWVVFVSTLQMTLALFSVKPDIVHLGKPQPMNGMAAWVYTHLKQRYMYLDCDDYEAASNRFSGAWQRKVIMWFEDHLPLQAKAITVNTHFTRDRLIALGCAPDKIIYIPNGVDRKRFSTVDEAKVKALQMEHQLPGKKVVLYVGSMSLVSHSVDLLVKAFAKVVETIDKGLLMLVGGGEDRQVLIGLSDELGLADKVVFVGRVDPANVPNYYRLADLSVDPVMDDDAFRGRSPLKIFESFAFGVPVVTGDVGDRRLILKNGDYGFLTESGNVDDLAKSLIAALSNESRLAEMKEKILAEREEAKIYWDLLADEFASVYEV